VAAGHSLRKGEKRKMDLSHSTGREIYISFFFMSQNLHSHRILGSKSQSSHHNQSHTNLDECRERAQNGLSTSSCNCLQQPCTNQPMDPIIKSEMEDTNQTEKPAKQHIKHIKEASKQKCRSQTTRQSTGHTCDRYCKMTNVPLWLIDRHY
jgi:hypothetical protein